MNATVTLRNSRELNKQFTTLSRPSAKKARGSFVPHLPLCLCLRASAAPLPAPLLHLKMLRRASATAIAAVLGDAEQDARKSIAELIVRRRCAPALLRLAFHDAATFDAEIRTGGNNASIR